MSLVAELKTDVILDKSSEIKLVPFSGDDLEIESLERWSRDPEVTRHLHRNSPYTDNPEKRVSVKEFIDFVIKSPGFAYFRIVHPKYGFIGHASFNEVNPKKGSFVRRIVIGEKQYWNIGIGGMVGNMILERARALGFTRAYSSTNINNIASVINLTRQFGEGKVVGDRMYFELDLDRTR